MNSNLNESTQQYKQINEDTSKMVMKIMRNIYIISVKKTKSIGYTINNFGNNLTQSQPQPQSGTPESESSNFECYQNYTAPEVFLQHIAGIVDQGDVEIIVRAQKQM